MLYVVNVLIKKHIGTDCEWNNTHKAPKTMLALYQMPSQCTNESRFHPLPFFWGGGHCTEFLAVRNIYIRTSAERILHVRLQSLVIFMKLQHPPLLYFFWKNVLITCIFLSDTGPSICTLLRICIES